jgi:hypothetical protein
MILRFESKVRIRGSSSPKEADINFAQHLVEPFLPFFLDSSYCTAYPLPCSGVSVCTWLIFY